MRDYSKVIKEYYESTIIPITLGATQLDINIVYWKQGGYNAASLSSATLALIMAGIQSQTWLLHDRHQTHQRSYKRRRKRNTQIIAECLLSANHIYMTYIDMDPKKLSTEQME